MLENPISKLIAESIRQAIEAKSDARISKATLTTSLALHIALEATADALGVDQQQFKRDCGVGQPLAYFV